ncbi:MAG: DUF523 and DUF1722 domain-containing protein [Methanobacteriaceae archaeon]|nr:DUF523 and DUF1722 domain-containing protein [Methanobacteriaceae archaeon]MDP2837151.1 DUF523 and DUF1722 domain-containing protein [Methanobacteriaceae archaeon]MDP3624104.1 DUF523 and DUF1722 domain-containing protein [Methanobacteriaceae archaeon]
MKKYQTPNLVVSKCIEFESCRYNGLIIASPLIKKLKDYVNFIPVCPEVEIGLGIPRDPIRLVEIDGEINLIQPSKDLNLTQSMEEFSSSFLSSLTDIDGFILKNKSPSCGVKAVRVYPHPENSRPKTDGIGLFANSVFNEFPYTPVEDEGRLRNLQIREDFLTAIYTLSDFRNMKKSQKVSELIDFHSQNKFLLMAYNQNIMREMGKILGEQKNYSNDDLFSKYNNMLGKTLKKPPEIPSNINVLLHVFGYVSDKLNNEEKAFFLDSLEKYRHGIMPLLVCLNLLKSWIIRFEQDYLTHQTFFQPYPPELMPVTTIER